MMRFTVLSMCALIHAASASGSGKNDDVWIAPTTIEVGKYYEHNDGRTWIYYQKAQNRGVLLQADRHYNGIDHEKTAFEDTPIRIIDLQDSCKQFKALGPEWLPIDAFGLPNNPKLQNRINKRLDEDAKAYADM